MLANILKPARVDSSLITAEVQTAHLFAPETLPDDIDSSRSNARVPVLVVVPHDDDKMVAIPYPLYRTKQSTKELSFTECFVFSNSDSRFNNITGSTGMNPIPVYELKEK